MLVQTVIANERKGINHAPSLSASTKVWHFFITTNHGGVSDMLE